MPTAAPRRSEAGYNMVILMVAVTLLGILTAAALPMWSHAMQREKEEELIFRGWQYAEAIRVFQQRHGRYPTRLQELIEVKPRSIRKLWKDPMTESGEWGLVFQGGVSPPGQGGGRELGGGGGLDDGRRDREPGPRAPRPGEQRTVGPIIGVRSLSERESIKVLFDQQSYDGWQFTAEQFTRGFMSGGRVTTGLDRVGAFPPVRADWIGRPFPPGLQPQQGQGPAGQQLTPDGRPAGARERPAGPARPSS